jgi:hypothetical protein
MLNRRQLLGSTLATSAGLALPSRVTARCNPRHLVIVLAHGGWDPTYVLDDKLSVSTDTISGPQEDAPTGNGADREFSRSYGDLAIVINPDRRPNVTAFFDTWVDPNASLAVPCTVINGVQVRSIGHRQNTVRVLTGTGDSSSPDFGVITGSTLGPELPIPHMDLSGVGMTGPLAVYTGLVGRRNQLGALLDPSQLVALPGHDPYPRSVQSDDRSAAIQEMLGARWATFSAERGTDAVSRANLDDYEQALWRAEALARQGEVLGEFIRYGQAATLAEQAEIGVQLLANKVSQTLCLCDLNLKWDTHMDNSGQHANFDGLFVGLDALLSELLLADLLEHTTVVVLSEMGRTPKRSSNGLGKDHWPVTSAMILGAGVQATRTIHATDELLDAQPVDLETGKPDPNGALIGYDTLVAGLLERLDVDPQEWLPGRTPFRGF